MPVPSAACAYRFARPALADARRDLGKLLNQLPDRQRLPIVHVKLEGLSVAETARLTGDELDKAGNVELRTWITLLGAVGDARAHVICYEPSWHHGNAVVEWPR